MIADDHPAVIREYLALMPIEHTEMRYARFREDFGIEPGVFIFDLRDPFGRSFAEGTQGGTEVARLVDYYEATGGHPFFYFLCDLAGAEMMLRRMAVGDDAFELFGDLPVFPARPGKFLLACVSRGGILIRWWPVPE